MDEVWNEILSEALERGIRESKGRAVPGAKLRQLVNHVASQRGLSYPPQGFEATNFSEFLKHFDSIVIVLRRRAQDILVAPASQPELLMSIGGLGSQPQIRADIFSAFTRIPRENDPRCPWYEQGHDRILWLPEAEGTASGNLIPIPPSSKDQEIADRRSFIESLQEEQGLLDSLRRVLDESGNSVLWSFSQHLRSAQLSRKWHEYRFQLVTSRIRHWSEAQRIPWQDSWLVAPGDLSNDAQVEAAVELASEKASLKDLISGLDEQDLRRINIPLDIVLKLLRR